MNESFQAFCVSFVAAFLADIQAVDNVKRFNYLMSIYLGGETVN